MQGLLFALFSIIRRRSQAAILRLVRQYAAYNPRLNGARREKPATAEVKTCNRAYKCLMKGDKSQTRIGYVKNSVQKIWQLIKRRCRRLYSRGNSKFLTQDMTAIKKGRRPADDKSPQGAAFFVHRVDSPFSD